MARTRIILAAVTAVVYVAAEVGNSLLNLAGNASHVSIQISLNQPVMWLIALCGLLIAVGLLGRYAWAWWLGLAASAFQLYRLGSRVINQYSLSHLPGMHVVLLFSLLVIFLLLLISPKAMASCHR